MNFEVLTSFLIISVGLTLTPGPDILYVLMQSISHGKKSGIAVSTGLVSGIIVHTTLIALGVSATIRQSQNLYIGIKSLGACYLFYLAYQAFRTSTSPINLAGQRLPKKSYSSLLKQGFIMNVMNPKVTIFFLAFFPAFIVERSGNLVSQIYTLGILFMLQAFIIFTTVAVIAGRLTVFLRSNSKFSRFLKWFQIIAYIVIALLLFI